MGKEPTCSAGDPRDMGSIPGSGRSLEEEMATYSSIFACRILWTEEPGRLQPMGSQRLRHVRVMSDSTKDLPQNIWQLQIEK